MSILISRRVPVLLALLVTMSLMALVPGVLAQTANTVELVGVIQSMSLNTITVNQQTIDISAAEINTALEIGAVVKVEGTLEQGGTISARQVNSAATGIQPGEAELIGVLESFSGTSMVVDGQTIDVTAAEVGRGVEVGQTVKVHATATGANTWRAREVEIFQPTNATPPQAPVDGEFEVTGTLESIGSGFIVVSGQTIIITGAEFNDPLLLGTLVKVHVSVVNGQLTAREIENADTDDDNANTNNNANANVNDNANNTNENLNANANANVNDNTSTNAVVSVQQAIDIVLQVYPNATIRSIELTTKFGGTLVWEIKIGNRIELNIDATSGAILTIDRPGDDDNQNANANQNGNDNNDDNGGMGSDDNGNQNGNDNNDDNGGDDNGGMGSDDGGSDDNGGMG